MSVIKNALSACLIDRDRLVVGTDDGLFCVDLDRDGKKQAFSAFKRIFTDVSTEICRIGDQKKIHQVEYLREEQLMIALTGKQRQVMTPLQKSLMICALRFLLFRCV